MNILIISNGAPGYYNFFNSLAIKFKEDGATIHFAVDCETSKEENELASLPFETHEFSSYFSRHLTDEEILTRYSRFNLNSALLSDYERADVYNLWSDKTPEFYEKLKSALLSFFERIIKTQNIDLVIYENVSNAFAHFAWFACQENDIIYRGISSSRLPGRFMITDDPLGDHLKIQETLEKISNGEIEIPESTRKWCREYLDNIENIVPDYMKFNNLENTSITKKYLKKEKIKKIILGIKHITDDHTHSFQRGNPINLSWQMFKRSLLRKLRIKTISKYYSTPKSNEEFILYPLHYHPESSTSILAGTYLNEFEVIRNISFNLPQGIKLYVKDHISAFGYPAVDFYRKISSLPNVRLLSPTAQTKQLIKASRAVITLTSTVGYEAALLNKKVFLFGSVFYQDHINVTKIRDPRNLFETINNGIKCKTAPNTSYNENFLASYFSCTIEGTLNLMTGKEETETKNREIQEKIIHQIKQTMQGKNTADHPKNQLQQIAQ